MIYLAGRQQCAGCKKKLQKLDPTELSMDAYGSEYCDPYDFVPHWKHIIEVDSSEKLGAIFIKRFDQTIVEAGWLIAVTCQSSMLFLLTRIHVYTMPLPLNRSPKF